MKTTRQAWFYPVVLAYAVIRSLLLVALAVSRGTSTDWLFVPIPVIWSLIPIAAIGRLSFNCRQIDKISFQPFWSL